MIFIFKFCPHPTNWEVPSIYDPKELIEAKFLSKNFCMTYTIKENVIHSTRLPQRDFLFDARYGLEA